MNLWQLECPLWGLTNGPSRTPGECVTSHGNRRLTDENKSLQMGVGSAQGQHRVLIRGRQEGQIPGQYDKGSREKEAGEPRWGALWVVAPPEAGKAAKSILPWRWRNSPTHSLVSLPPGLSGSPTFHSLG